MRVIYQLMLVSTKHFSNQWTSSLLSLFNFPVGFELPPPPPLPSRHVGLIFIWDLQGPIVCSMFGWHCFHWSQLSFYWRFKTVLQSRWASCCTFKQLKLLIIVINLNSNHALFYNNVVIITRWLSRLDS